MAWDGDLASTHNPATSTAPPASWGDKINDNFAYLDGKETYTPTIEGSSSNPTYTIDKAVFQEVGDWGRLMVQWTFTTKGSGNYTMTLPSGWGLYGVRQSGTAILVDGGSTIYPMFAFEGGVANKLAFFTAHDRTVFSDTGPVTIASGDTVTVNLPYVYLGS